MYVIGWWVAMALVVAHMQASHPMFPRLSVVVSGIIVQGKANGVRRVRIEVPRVVEHWPSISSHYY